MPIVNVPDRPLFGIPFGGRALELSNKPSP